MDRGGSAAVRALREAQAVAAYARRTGCGVDEAADALADRARMQPALEDPSVGRAGRTGGSRRAVLGGAGAAALAAAFPAGLVRPTAGGGQHGPARGDHRLGPGRARLRLPAVDQAWHPQ
jgi:hypothetical protein